VLALFDREWYFLHVMAKRVQHTLWLPEELSEYVHAFRDKSGISLNSILTVLVRNGITFDERIRECLAKHMDIVSKEDFKGVIFWEDIVDKREKKEPSDGEDSIDSASL